MQFPVRVVHLYHAVEAVLFEISGQLNILVLVFFELELVDVRFNISEETAVVVAFGIQRDAQAGVPVRVAIVEQFVQMQAGGRNMSFQVCRNIVFFVCTEYHVGLHRTDRRRELSERHQVIEEAGYLSGKIDRTQPDDRIGQHDRLLVEIVYQARQSVGRDIHLVYLSEDIGIFRMADPFQVHFSDKQHLVAVTDCQPLQVDIVDGAGRFCR